MRKIANVFITFMLLIFINACIKENTSNTDEYYVKYEIISTASPYSGVKLNTSFNNEQNETNLISHNTGTWETIIGPVKKGFVAQLSTNKNGWTGGIENHLKMTINILTSKNNSPFALKKFDNSTTPRGIAQLSYTIE